jgi:hypothetical protein
MGIETFNVGDTVSQSGNNYSVISKNDTTKKVQVKHCACRYICEFEYGSEFKLVREANSNGAK